MTTAPQMPDPRPGPDKSAALVQAMFDRVAPRYDFANSVFSFGQDRHWRRVAAKAAAAGPGDVVVDVAAGTGALAHDLAGAGATVVAVDFSWNMLAAGADRARRGVAGDPSHPVRWCNADALRLPFADASVDAVTISFGLRNLPDPAAGLEEFARIVRPGGRLVVLEFSQPTWAPFRDVYQRYLLGAIPRLARGLTSDPLAYRYLADSIQAWPDADALAAVVAEAGWAEVRYAALSGGIVAAHRAVRR